MKRFPTLWKVASTGLLLAAAATQAISQATGDMTDAQKQDVLTKVEAVVTRAAFVPGADFSKWPEMVKENQAEFDKAKSDQDFANVVNKLLNNYGYSHISLFTPEYGTMRQTQSKAGIGIRIQIEDDGLRVTAVFPNSPASDVGIREGDVVFESDGKPVRAVEDLAGTEGQASKVKVRRGEDVKEFDVTRRKYSTVIPESIQWHEKVAQIKIPTFDAGYSTENVNKIMLEAASKADAIVLDLRGNGGGRVVNLQHLAGYFLKPDEEPMGTFIGRQQVAAYEKEFGNSTDLAKIAEFSKFKVRARRTSADAVVNVPVAVLIDGGTGSASEMMAAALKEYKSSPVIGSKSAGAVLASQILPLGDERGFWIQFPMTDYVTIKGLRLEGNGVTPTATAPPLEFGKPDQALSMALKQLGTKTN